MKPEYIEKLKDLRQQVKTQLESKGLYVEEGGEDISLSISLTQFGVSTMYATVTQEELEYFVDNEIEI